MNLQTSHHPLEETQIPTAIVCSIACLKDLQVRHEHPSEKGKKVSVRIQEIVSLKSQTLEVFFS